MEINLLFDENTVYGIFVIVAPRLPQEVTFVNIVGKIAPERVEELLGNLSNFGATDIDLGGKLKKGQWRTEDTREKATVMILGSTFFTNPGINVFNTRMDECTRTQTPTRNGTTDISN